MELFQNQQWLLIAIIFFGIIAYIAIMRQRDRKWIDNRFGLDKARAMSFGVNYFGLASEPGKVRRSAGFLLLLSDRLFYRSRISRIELEIRGDRITHVYPDNSHKGQSLHQSVMKVAFIRPDGEKDAAAFKVPYPPQWISAIKAAFQIGDKRRNIT